MKALPTPEPQPKGEMRTYEIELKVAEKHKIGPLYIELNTYQGTEAAVRRATWTLISHYRSYDITPDDITVGKCISIPFGANGI